MRYKTVAEIVDYSREIHRALSAQYAELEQLASTEQAQFLLDYLNRHEQHMAQALSQFQGDGAQAILNSWLQYSPEFYPQSLPELVDKVRGARLKDVRDIVRVALEVDDYLVKIYQEILENTDSAKVREVLSNLLQMEEKLRDNLAAVLEPFTDR